MKLLYDCSRAGPPAFGQRAYGATLNEADSLYHLATSPSARLQPLATRREMENCKLVERHERTVIHVHKMLLFVKRPRLRRGRTRVKKIGRIDFSNGSSSKTAFLEPLFFDLILLSFSPSTRIRSCFVSKYNNKNIHFSRPFLELF